MLLINRNFLYDTYLIQIFIVVRISKYFKIPRYELIGFYMTLILCGIQQQKIQKINTGSPTKFDRHAPKNILNKSNMLTF